MRKPMRTLAAYVRAARIFDRKIPRGDASCDARKTIFERHDRCARRCVAVCARRAIQPVDRYCSWLLVGPREELGDLFVMWPKPLTLLIDPQLAFRRVLTMRLKNIVLASTM